MQVKARDPVSGRVYSYDAKGLTSTFIASMAKLDFSESGIKDVIDNLNVSADVKSILFSMSKATIQVGRTVVRIGRKVLDIIVGFFKEYPHVGYGLLLGALLGGLLSSIPVIGWLFGPLLTPAFLAFGVATGAIQDISDMKLCQRIKEAQAQFSELRGS